MAEESGRPAGQDGGRPTASLGQPRVADGVDALMDSVKTSGGDSMLDGAPSKPRGGELPACNDAVLQSRQIRDPPVDPGDLSIHVMEKSPNPSHGGRLARRSAHVACKRSGQAHGSSPPTR